MPHRPENIPADAQPDNWVDVWAPAPARPYLRLMRADRPIGTWLLLLPCWFGMTLGMVSTYGPGGLGSFITPAHFFLSTIFWKAALFAIGAFVMRGAGCVYNDIVDRDIDAKVARTTLRPIPAGDVTLRQAWMFLIALCLTGLLVLIQFNRSTIITAIAALALVAAYPFMKRITWWPQLWLGLTFNWGALVGYTAFQGAIELPALLLYGACIFWTLGYDTIYAHQDREDDALIGVKSSARALGGYTHRALMVFYWMTVLLAMAALYYSGAISLVAYALFMPLIFHFGWQVGRLDINNGHNCLILFKSNRNAGFLLLLPLIGNAWIRWQGFSSLLFFPMPISTVS